MIKIRSKIWGIVIIGMFILCILSVNNLRISINALDRAATNLEQSLSELEGVLGLHPEEDSDE